MVLRGQGLHFANGLGKEFLCVLLAYTRLFGSMGARLLGCVLLVYLFFDVFEFLQGTDAVLHGTASVRVAGAQCQNGLL